MLCCSQHLPRNQPNIFCIGYKILKSKFVQELYQRGAIFMRADSTKPFSGNHPTDVIIRLSLEEVKELRYLSFKKETKKLSEIRCSECSIGTIVKEKVSHNGAQHIRYNCTCDGSNPINHLEWIPIGEKDP